MIENHNEQFSSDYLQLQKKERERLYLNSIFRIPDENQKNNFVINKNLNKNNYSNHFKNINLNTSAPLLNFNRINNSKFNHLNFPNPFIMQNNTERHKKYNFNSNGYFPDEMIQNNHNNFFYNSDSHRKTNFNIKNKINKNNKKCINPKVDCTDNKNIINNSNFQIDKNSAKFQYHSPELIPFKNFDKKNFPLNDNNNKINCYPQQKKLNKLVNSVINLNHITDSNYIFQNNDFPQKNHLTQPLNNNIQNKIKSPKILNAVEKAQAYKLRYKNTGYHYNFEFVPKTNNNFVQNSIEQEFINNNLIDNENNAYIYQKKFYNSQEKKNNNNKKNNVINKINNNKENKINENNDDNDDFEEEFFYYKENCNSSQNMNGIDYYQGQDTIKEVNEDMEYSSSERKSIGDSNKKNSLLKTLKKSNTLDKLKNNSKKISVKLGENNFKIMKNNKTMTNSKNNSRKNQKTKISKNLNNSNNLIKKKNINKKEQKLKQFLTECKLARNPEFNLNYPKPKQEKKLCNSYRKIEYKKIFKSNKNECRFSFSKLFKNFEFNDDFKIRKNIKKNISDLSKKHSKNRKRLNTGLLDKNIKIKKGIIDKEKILKKRRVKTPLPAHFIEKNGN